MTQKYTNLLAGLCEQSFRYMEFSPRVQTIARNIENARKQGRQVATSISWRDGGLSQDEAYEVAAAGCALRMLGSRKSLPIGRKIGFTNKSIWEDHNIDAPNWGYVYADTILPPGPSAAIRRNFMMKSTEWGLQPHIAPELVLSMRRAPSSSMSDAELAGCVAWFALGLEIVHSVYPDLRFTAPETTAAGALHCYLFTGTNLRVRTDRALDELAQGLTNLEVGLNCNGIQVESGSTRNVLGSPLNALRHLCAILEVQSLHPRIQPGEIITTGTMTKVKPISPGETWTVGASMRDTGLGDHLEPRFFLPLTVKFTSQDFLETHKDHELIVPKILKSPGQLSESSVRKIHVPPVRKLGPLRMRESLPPATTRTFFKLTLAKDPDI